MDYACGLLEYFIHAFAIDNLRILLVQERTIMAVLRTLLSAFPRTMLLNRATGRRRHWHVVAGAVCS
jgi:hypothetical protein